LPGSQFSNTPATPADAASVTILRKNFLRLDSFISDELFNFQIRLQPQDTDPQYPIQTSLRIRHFLTIQSPEIHLQLALIIVVAGQILKAAIVVPAKECLNPVRTSGGRRSRNVDKEPGFVCDIATHMSAESSYVTS
jgi:hypothetical protein